MAIVVSDELLTKLREVFPDQIPREPEVSIRKIVRLQGEQRVIAYLASLNESILEET